MEELGDCGTYRGQSSCNVSIAFSLGDWAHDDYLLYNVVTIFESMFVSAAVLRDLNTSLKNFIPLNNL